MSNPLHEEQKMLVESIHALVIERYLFFDELFKTNNLLQEIVNEVWYFGYPHLLDENVQTLA